MTTRNRRSPASVSSLELLEPIYETLECISSDNRTLKTGKTVKIGWEHLQSTVHNISIREVFLRRPRLCGAKNLEGLLEAKLNGVVMILEVEESDSCQQMVQGIKQIPLAQVGHCSGSSQRLKLLQECS